MSASGSLLPPRRLIRGSRVAGTSVYDPRGERLGHIDELMIDKQTGRVAYAVLAFGGFLGINDKHHPLPWSSLRYDPALDGYVVDIDTRTLQGAPAYAVEDKADWTDQGWGHVDDYYGARPDEDEIPLDPTGAVR